MPDSDQDPPISASGPDRPFGEIPGPHAWENAASGHLGESNRMRTSALAVVRGLGERWDAVRDCLADDPWLDERFADRYTERIRWIVAGVLALDDGYLSDAEKTSLVVFPYFHQVFWSGQAAEVLQGRSPAELAFGRVPAPKGFRTFSARHGTLHRRGTRAFEAGDPAANSIGWWLFRQWLVRRSACYYPSNVEALLPARLPEPLSWVLAPMRLMELMRVVQIDSAFLRDLDRERALRPVAHIAGGTEFEQELREQLIGYLLVFGHRTAIDPIALPRVIVDHIGIDDGVTPQEVLESIGKARWEGRRTRMLVAGWTHPATALALREQAAAVDAVLSDIAAVSGSRELEALQKMPVRVTMQGIDAGLRVPAALGHQFRLADDRIQELLMGEQLYGSPELAIRELYQNALDACRYREARTTYLTRTGKEVEPWRGRIGFRQDVDEDGRPYLECEDNGIGMGNRELVEVFSRAGIRFADLPEYVEEQADWDAEGIESYPNSRFGIGVLSYFMLADEITVTTCRLSRKGRPGRRLEVHIAGPGALFRVRDLGQGGDAGTVVRLWLRPTGKPVHCTDLLRRILWVSDYRVSSDDLSGRQSWEPGRLSAMAPIGTDALADDARKVAGQVIPAEGGKVWWCDTRGAVLADGIWAGTSVFGAVVNLTGRDLPRLTIDRRTIIDLDRPLVEEMMRRAVPALLGEHSPLSHQWLSTLVTDMPRLADDICERAIEVSYRPWRIADTEVPIEVVGCFPLDEQLLSGQETQFFTISDAVGSWRLAAWLRAHQHPDQQKATDPIVPALPSDEILLTLTSPVTTVTRFPSKDVPLALGHVLTAALRTQRSPAEVAARLTMLGYPIPAHLPTEAEEADPVVLNKSRSGRPLWMSWGRPVSHHHVIVAAVESRLTPRAVADRLIELGFEVPTASRLPAVVHPIDKTLIRQARSAAWEKLDQPVPAAHVMVAAARAGRTPDEVGRRLVELGYTVPEGLPQDPDNHDEIVFTDHSDYSEAYVRSPVPARHITFAAIRTGRPPAEVRARLAAAGYEVPPMDELPEAISPADAVLTLPHHPDGTRSDGLQRTVEIALGHVLAAALKTNQTPSEVARRLVELGYTTPPPDQLPDRVDEHDLILVSTGVEAVRRSFQFTHQSTWLPFGDQVPVQHIAVAAAKTGRSPQIVADRLRELGFGVPPEESLGFEANDDDVTLLSASLNGRPPWLVPSHPALVATDMTLPIGHAIAAGHLLGKTPAKVVARLASLGLRTEAADLPAQSDPMDVEVLSRALDTSHWWIFNPAEFLWLGVTTPADALHLVIAAARARRSPAAVAQRLSDLGIPVVSTSGLPKSVDQDDLFLLSTSPNGKEPFRSLDAAFPRGRVMLAAHRLRTSPGNVLDRLRRLGIELGP